METPTLRTQCFWLLLIILVPGLVCVLGFGAVATAGYADSAHGDDTNGVERSGCQDSQEPPQACPTGSCANCHDSFDPDICTGVTGGPHQLFAELDNPDFCMECHTDTDPVQVLPDAAANIADVFAKTYKHNVLGYSGLHRFWYASPPAETSSDVEDRTYLSANKHVECNDCHNPHLAEDGLHNELASNAGFHLAARTNEIDPSDPLYPDAGPINGAYGAPPTSWQSWSRYSMSWNSGGANWPTTSSTAAKEYELCFKCHTNYNTSFSSWGGADEAAWTNLALEFNPNKQSYHPVAFSLPATDPGYDAGSDNSGSNQLPPAFSSPVIGDSGYATGGGDFYISDTTKSWTTNQWENWGLRPGTISGGGDYRYTYIGRITGNSATQVNVTWSQILGLGYDSFDTVYSIEYYAGFGAKSGTTVTDTNKDFTLYLPSLKGYKVVIFDNMSGGNQNFAEGIITSSDATTFTVSSWTAWDNSPGVPSGSVPANGTVNYYVSAAGQTMMCSDCHSNDTISSTAAQGPHGSSVKWMLKGRNKAWPTLAASENGSGTGTLRKIGRDTAPPVNHRSLYDGTDNGLFCLNCHSTASFSKNKWGIDDWGNIHAIHSPNTSTQPECVRCHIMVPHGGAMSRLMGNTCTEGPNPSAMPDRYAFDNTLSNNYLTHFKKTFDGAGGVGDPAAYVGDNSNFCSSETLGCHDNDYCGW